MTIDSAVRRRQLRVVVAGSLAGAALGLGYVLALAPWSLGAALRGLGAGAAIAFGVTVMEMLGATSAAGRALRRLPFAAFILAKTALWLAWILAVLAVVRALAPAVERGAFVLLADVAYSLGVSLLVVSLMEIDRLLGQGVLWRLVTGRYHRPVIEERAFLLLDLVGSTAIAERLGDERFLALLDRVIVDVSEDIAAHDGEIYRYLGDAIFVSWPLERAVADARIVRCLVGVSARMDRNREAYARRFGVAPTGRAALHARPLAIGEIGELRREIMFLGDTLNTAARIEQECRRLGRYALISDGLLARIALPEGVRAVPLGAVPLPGKALPVELHALEWRQRAD